MSSGNIFLSLPDSLQERLEKLGITEPTPVQQEIIPRIAGGANVVFQSETGTGKTFAYLLPLVARLEQEDDGTRPRILIIAPTFELASQINAACKTVTGRKSQLLIGGVSIKRQLEMLKEKPQIIIGTSARITELTNLKKLRLDQLFACVFDETDRLVKKECVADTVALKGLLPGGCQLIACSATINTQTKAFFDGIENIILPPEDVLRKKITHWAIFAENRDKIDTLRKFLAAEKPGKALIFTSRADQVENIRAKLAFKKVDCAALHAKADKQERKATIDRFRSGKISVLITSDLAARGLDIPDITHVIQMDFPADEDFFIHRSGRTARAGRTGINVVIGDEYELRKYAALEKKLGLTVYPKQLYGGKILAPQA